MHGHFRKVAVAAYAYITFSPHFLSLINHQAMQWGAILTSIHKSSE